ncbi:putative L-type lectin-domain containing receptor kinase II.2 [Cardamine amara subsp. amara]|uniref:L-type lectin-domain containing receptor kinase II.2 n=1 Tax=Cardamine amara subsp. amara TaxID=228776 RepID=A0ABD1ANI0_CARAN
MARVLGGSLGFLIIIVIHVIMSLVLPQDGDQFLYYGFKEEDLDCDGMAHTQDGVLHLTNNTDTSTGHAFYKIPMKFTGTSFSFSTEFVFAMFPLQISPPYGQGMAFVVSPTKDLRYNGSATSGLGLFNYTNNNKTENHILVVELDTNNSPEADDINNNHVGIDINSRVSVKQPMPATLIIQLGRTKPCFLLVEKVFWSG